MDALNLMPLRDLVERVEYAVSRDQTRLQLCGVFLEREGDDLLAVATDGHRLARAIEPGFPLAVPKAGVILSADAIKGLKAALPRRRAVIHGTTRVDEKHLVLEVGGKEHRLELVNGEFPNYRLLIPKQSQQPTRFLGTHLAELAEGLGKIHKSRMVRIEIAGDGIALTAEQDLAGGRGSIKGAGSIPACVAKAATFYADGGYLADALHALPGDVELYPPEDGKKLSPIVIQHATSGELAVVMPMRGPEK